MGRGRGAAAIRERARGDGALTEPASDPLDELYLGDFAGFVARRNALAKRLKGEGHEDAAERVRKLTKPSRVAWAVNQLGDREHTLRDELLEAGAWLREAQEQLVSGTGDRAALKAARDRERAVVGRAISTIGKLMAADATELSASAAERARQTLHAVALDGDVRRDFEEHRLEADRDATGLRGLPAGATPSKKDTPKKRAAKPKTDGAAEQRRREALKEARAEARGREHDQLEAEKAVEAARHAAGKAQKRLDEAARALEKATDDAAAATRHLELLDADAG